MIGKVLLSFSEIHQHSNLRQSFTFSTGEFSRLIPFRNHIHITKSSLSTSFHQNLEHTTRVDYDSPWTRSSKHLCRALLKRRIKTISWTAALLLRVWRRRSPRRKDRRPTKAEEKDLEAKQLQLFEKIFDPARRVQPSLPDDKSKPRIGSESKKSIRSLYNFIEASLRHWREC